MESWYAWEGRPSNADAIPQPGALVNQFVDALEAGATEHGRATFLAFTSRVFLSVWGQAWASHIASLESRYPADGGSTLIGGRSKAQYLSWAEESFRYTFDYAREEIRTYVTDAAPDLIVTEAKAWGLGRAAPDLAPD